MKQLTLFAASSDSRRLRRAGRYCQLAGLVAVAAGAGCGSESPEDLPLQPCGVEERFSDPEILSFVHRTYDELGNHVRSERDANGDGMADDVFVWEYAPSGGVTLIQQSFSSGRMQGLAAQYGDDGRLASVTWTTIEGDTGRADYEHDGEQRIIERWDRNDDGVAEASSTYTYDADGRLEQSAFACAGAEPTSITTMQYGAGGRIERVESRANGMVTSATQYSYDQDGLLQGWESSIGGTVVSTGTYEHDAGGNVIKTTIMSRLALGEDPPTWSSTDTVYDEDGRMLSSQTSVNGTSSSSNTFLYECPDHQESPGRLVAKAYSPLPVAPRGPRGGLDRNAIFTYANGGSSCL
jgi:hypothetical protein